jgi:hypothetical protein
MPTTTNYGWTTPADTDLVKDGAAAIRTLGSSIDSTLKTQIDAQIPDSLLTTKGDLIAATGASTPARLAVGSNDQVLIADSTAATGIKWGTPSSGGMTLLSTTTLSGSTTTVSSISGAYTNLMINILNPVMSAPAAIYFKPNNVAQAIFNGVRYTTSAAVFVQNGTMDLSEGANIDNTGGGTCYTVILNNYATGNRKPCQWYGEHITSGSYKCVIGGGAHYTTSAITSIALTLSTGTFSGGTVEIYGVK